MRYIGFIFALCLSIQAIASNTITLSSVSGTPQTEVEVVVSLDNTDAITALELNIPLGEYLSYVDGSTVLASSRSNGHLLTATQVQQELRICVYSLNLSALQGNNGELLSFRLKLGNEPATYTLTPSVILSDARGQLLEASVQSGQVSILAPKLEILNPQIDYGHIPIRETYTQDLQLYNAGTLPLIIEDIVVNDPAFTPAQTALTIEVGEVAYTTIHYAPTARGAIQKEVVVTSNAINGKQMGTIVADPFSVNELHVVGGSGITDNAVTISLKMNNMEPIVGMQCTFVLPEQLEYIAGSLSASSSRSNGHQAMASVKKFVEQENQWYDSKGDTLVLMLYSMANQPLNGNDGEIATFQVRLNGNSGSYALTPRDVVLTNATAENMVSATYEGWVEIQSPQFYGNDYLSFGDWSITDDIVANYVVSNYGDASLEIERVTFLAQGYRVVSTMPLQINPWEESTMQIAYDPAAEGDFSTTMNIYTNDPTTRMKAVAVSGHVYEPNTLSVDGERMQDGSYQLAISLDNYTNIVGVQYDIHWRSDMTTSQAAFTPTARLQNHTYAIMPIGQNTYRVLIYSLSNTPITGKEGELHQLLFTPQGDVDYCGDVLTIDNIVLSNANGTDKVSQSTVLHHLPTTQYSEQTITACDQYVYNNKVYQSSGTYIDTLQTVGGCDSIVTTYLTINRSEREEYYETVCDEFYWDHNGETYYESGDYEYYTTTEQGCERVEVLHLTINRSEREEYNETACDEFYWDHNGETYYESGDYEYYATTEQGCERVEVLHLTINHSEREEYRLTTCKQYEWHGQIYTESGDYEYHTTTEHGCERVEVLHLTISDREQEEFYETACEEYYWNGQTYTESGDYTFNTTSSSGCDRTEVLHLTIYKRDTVHYYETACDRYYWNNNGNEYYDSSDYEYYTTNEHGCERVEILHLTINHSEREEYYVTTCNQYEWHGQVYTEPGDYEYYTTTEYGCERVEVLHLSFSDREYEEYYETACDQYEWHGEVYTESGDYTFNTISSSGCERVEVLHLTINRSEREEYYEYACDSYEWHGQVYTESGTYEYHTTTDQGCERVEVLHLTIYHSEYEDYWVTACDEYWWNNNQYTESGDYTYSFVRVDWGSGYCERTEVLHLTINHREREEYWATACDEYYWDRNGNTYYDSGDYEHYTTTEQGCERVEVLHLTINRSEREEYWETACDSYEWYGQVYTASGDYEYRTTLENGCERVEVLHLTIYNSQYEEYWETACDAYGWWGNTYTESGDYTYSFVIADWGSGYCERTEVLHLTINKRDTVHYYETACDEYWWDPYGLYYNTSGDYEYYTTNEYGCERVEILHLTINYSEHQDYYENACDAYEWHGETYTQSGNYEYRTTLENGCERVEVLHLTIYNSQYEEYWETACDEYYWWNGERYTESGDYTYSYIIVNWGSGYCEHTDVLHLTINKRDTVHYYETACDEYWWDPYGYYYNTSGDYEHYTTNEYGCERVEVLHLTINRSEHQEYYENACDAYEWHGNTYTESGDYEYRTTLENGCERVEVLHLTIYNSQYEEYWETACDEYWWNGNQYTESGDYTYSYPLYNWGTGTCDRTEVLHLTINKRDTVHYYETACDEYWWDPYGQYYNTSGDYENYTTNEYGCERVEILHLTINYSEYEEYWETACDSYEWHGEVYTERGNYEYYTTTEQGCPRTEVLHLTIKRSKREEYWETACDQYEWHGQVYTESGDYTYNTTTANGCERVEILHLTINKSEGEEYTATACDQYEWHGQVYTESGYYEFHTTTVEGCERLEILHLTILPDALTETEELALCPAELPYEWYGYSLTEAGSYTATEQYAAGCDSVVHELTLNVYVQTLPTQVTLPIVRKGEAIDVSIPTAEIQAHIAADTWYAPNALVNWYIQRNADWTILTTDPVESSVSEVVLKYAVDTDCGSIESEPMSISVETTAVDNIQTDKIEIYKIIRDDKLWIIRNGKIYSAEGHLISRQ